MTDFAFSVATGFTARMYDATSGALVAPDSKLHCGSELHYGSERQVIRAIKADAKEHVARALRAAENKQRALIVTNHGTILLVAYENDGWGYDILRDGMNCGSTSYPATDKFNDVVAGAISHAEQCYDGVAWFVVL